jgi:hypothetical protein
LDYPKHRFLDFRIAGNFRIMSKTRSGTIMRRVLAAISNTMNVSDVTTLANPEVVEEVRKMVQGEAQVQSQGRGHGPGDRRASGTPHRNLKEIS